ncbi:hypothetical protein DEO72_LG7g2003 [Vigna unguiculata]|uniref:Uncharacterized protein n=1 Tax=Vigna unguiculata TaxID=3917 RepID=A0A4D6MH12_VIGUN|nr:hypothetical protein DEO72_LG7g2003 [Vigna unguiculata]
MMLGDQRLAFPEGQRCMESLGEFLEKFQKLPGGLLVVARRLILMSVYFGFLERNRLAVSSRPPSDA